MVRAERIEAAFANLDHPETILYELPADVVWPRRGGESIWWEIGQHPDKPIVPFKLHLV
jgi:hypothetical protein